MLKLKIRFKFFPLTNGKNMIVQVEDDILIPDSAGIAEITMPLELPSSVQISVNGKDMNQDTKLNSTGQLIEDLHVKIVGIALDGFEVPAHQLHKIISLTTDQGQVVNSPYIGFNGKIILDLPCNTVFQQVMAWTA